MISNRLNSNIENYIKKIGVVPERQIYQMFSEHNRDTIEYCLNSLMANSKVRYNKSTKSYRRRQSVNERDFGQQLLTQSAWILAYMGENEVLDFFPIEYPAQLFIIGANNACYDVTVFTYTTLDALRMAVPVKRQTLLPKGVDDEIIHIALIPDKEMASDIKDLGFDNFCIIDAKGVPHYHRWKG